MSDQTPTTPPEAPAVPEPGSPAPDPVPHPLEEPAQEPTPAPFEQDDAPADPANPDATPSEPAPVEQPPGAPTGAPLEQAGPEAPASTSEVPGASEQDERPPLAEVAADRYTRSQERMAAHDRDTSEEG